MSGAQQPVSHVDAVRLQNITSAYSQGEIPKGSLAAKASAAADFNMNLPEGEKPIMTGELKESGVPMLQREGRQSQEQVLSQRSQHSNRGDNVGVSSQSFSQQQQTMPSVISQSGQQSSQGQFQTESQVGQTFSQGNQTNQERFPLSQPGQQSSQSQQPNIHKMRQERFSHKIDHLKEAHQLPEGMQPITKEDARSFVENQSPVHANEEPERSINAKVVMTAMINEVKQGGHGFEDQERGSKDDSSRDQYQQDPTKQQRQSQEDRQG
jgi:hypothetical protein